VIMRHGQEYRGTAGTDFCFSEPGEWLPRIIWSTSSRCGRQSDLSRWMRVWDDAREPPLRSADDRQVLVYVLRGCSVAAHRAPCEDVGFRVCGGHAPNFRTIADSASCTCLRWPGGLKRC